MFLKIMSGESTPDSDPRKSFQLLDNVESAIFKREDNGNTARVEVLFEDGGQEDFPCAGNCYLMNNAGNTVAKFGPHPIHHRAAA